jgi:hypothetical protein
MPFSRHTRSNNGQQVCLGAAVSGRNIDVWVTDQVFQFYVRLRCHCRPVRAPDSSDNLAQHRRKPHHVATCYRLAGIGVTGSDRRE